MRYRPDIASNSGGLTADRILAMIVGVVRMNLPGGVDEADLNTFLAANRSGLLTQLSPLVGLLGGARPAAPPPVTAVPEHWTPGKRTTANLAALRVLAGLGVKAPDAQQRLVLSQYSGWGGLSIKKVRDQLPAGLPEPEDFGLIHEYLSLIHI